MAKLPSTTKENSSSSSSSSSSTLFPSSSTNNAPKKRKITVQTQITSIFNPRPSGSGKKTSEKEGGTRVVMLKKGGSRAKLSLLPSLPLDLLFEIFGHLMPLDVLHLARTNKDLRRAHAAYFVLAVLHKSATTIWKTAFDNVLGLPRCPNDMTHPAWASLVFESTCQNCQAQNVRTVDWYLQSSPVLSTYLPSSYLPVFLHVCLSSAISASFLRLLNPSRIFRFLSLVMEEKDQKKIELEKGAMELSKLVQSCVPFSEWFREKGNLNNYCLQSVKDKVLEEFKKCPKESVERLAEERKAQLKERFEHAKLCNAWYESQKNNRAKELEGIRKKREEAIERKLIGMGYEAELDFLQTTLYTRMHLPDFPLFDEHPLVRHPKPLTERNWENIRPKLQEYMALVRTERLKDERSKVLWNRRSTIMDVWHSLRDGTGSPSTFGLGFSPGEFLPNTIDIWLWPPMKAIIEQPNSVIVSDITFKEDYPDVVDKLPGFVKSWQEEKMQQLVRQLYDSRSSKITWQWRANTRNLELARCVFTCSRWLFHNLYEEYQEDMYPCMFFPEFLFHPCNALCTMYTTDVEDKDTIEGVNEYTPLRTRCEWEGLRRRQWSTRWLTFDEKASKTVENILEACGLAKDSTVQEVEEKDLRVVCLKCSYGQKIDGERMFAVMTWRAAVQHSMKKHWGDSQVTWRRVADEDVPIAKALEEKEPARRGGDWVLPPERPWRCTFCRDKYYCEGLMTLDEMKRHHRKKHKENEGVEIKENVHYYRGLDKTPRVPYPVRMIPRAVVEEEDGEEKT
ncbi:hypothetical protein D9758_014551 [Tetrapyrgos nigripes]|uniref:F-box domain-containing protein n=1 Tax=Tetrapyrgos nigripes TaxID=182062 RepID=A0A8H5CFV7_9AGAR|nr:hypothetical protein D9758_014551 [Tetrapyrgos nigripes]